MADTALTRGRRVRWCCTADARKRPLCCASDLRRSSSRMERRLGISKPKVVRMSREQEREAARLLALVLRDHTTEWRGLRSPLRSGGAMGGALCSATRRPRVRRDRRCGSESGDPEKSDIGGR